MEDSYGLLFSSAIVGVCPRAYESLTLYVINTCSAPMAILYVQAAKRECTIIALLVGKSWGTSDAWPLRKSPSRWSYHADTKAPAAQRYIHIITNWNMSSNAGSDLTIVPMPVQNAWSLVTFQCSSPTWKMITRWICTTDAHSIIVTSNLTPTKWKMRHGCSL